MGDQPPDENAGEQQPQEEVTLPKDGTIDPDKLKELDASLDTFNGAADVGVKVENCTRDVTLTGAEFTPEPDNGSSSLSLTADIPE